MFTGTVSPTSLHSDSQQGEKKQQQQQQNRVMNRLFPNWPRTKLTSCKNDRGVERIWE